MNSHRLPLLAQRVLNTPLCLHPAKAELILAAIGQRFGVLNVEASFGTHMGGAIPFAPPAPLREYGSADGYPCDNLPYDVAEGVAILPVEGTLVAKNNTVRPYSGMTGYDGIASAFAIARADKKVRAIVLDIDSGGGECAGLFDLVDNIAAARGSKPIWAILTEHAYSAGYAIACAADRIIMPRTGGCGSIGAIVLQAEITGLLKNEGVTVNIIRSADRKGRGGPYEPLDDTTRSRIELSVQKSAELFIETVAQNRAIPVEDIEAMEAECYDADEALKLKLVDAVMSPDDAFAELVESLPA